MKHCSRRSVLRLLCGATATSAFFGPFGAGAQWPFAPSTTPAAQKNALNAVRSQVNWVHNATKTASNYGEQGPASVWRTFDDLRQAYYVFKQTLTPQQLTYGANSLAELDAGLGILEEAFVNYDEDRARGQSLASALRTMCRLLSQGTALWAQELNKTCSRLRVGWP